MNVYNIQGEISTPQGTVEWALFGILMTTRLTQGLVGNYTVLFSNHTAFVLNRQLAVFVNIVWCSMCLMTISLFSIELGEPPLVKTAANFFRSYCYKERDRQIAGIICAGWDKREGGQVGEQSSILICVHDLY